MRITYKGITKNGGSVTGVTELSHFQSPATFTETRFWQGYRSLVVERDGELVGRIGRDDKGKRSWWAER